MALLSSIANLNILKPGFLFSDPPSGNVGCSLGIAEPEPLVVFYLLIRVFGGLPFLGRPTASVLGIPLAMMTREPF